MVDSSGSVTTDQAVATVDPYFAGTPLTANAT